jgi:hypothetical protein
MSLPQTAAPLAFTRHNVPYHCTGFNQEVREPVLGWSVGHSENAV